MQVLRRIASFILWHRRVAAALCAALAAAGIVSAAASPPPGKSVVGLASAVAAGETITAAALTTVELPAHAVTPDTIRSLNQVDGAQAAVALEPGQVLTQSLLLRGGVAAEGKSLVPILVDSPELRSLLAPGATVQLIVALGEVPEVLTVARIASMPAEAGSTVASARSGTGMIVVEVPTDRAPIVATLGQGGQLAVVLGAK